MKVPAVPVSWGELIDKITILEIKRRHIVREPAASNVRKELGLLNAIAQDLPKDPILDGLKAELQVINAALWDIEDEIRVKESRQQFDAGFIELARSVYKKNDIRADIKKRINQKLVSELVEEKSFSTGPKI